MIVSKFNYFVINIIRKIADAPILKPFLSKPFSLELLFILLEQNEFEGIERLFQVLVSPKPKYPAYKNFLLHLQQKNCIEIKNGKTKMSSKTLSLTENAKKALSEIGLVQKGLSI